jgi:hypothetical protein
LNGESLRKNGFHVYFFEWGDSTTSITPGDSIPVAIKPIDVITPEDYQLSQNYPNPFNPTTNIDFKLPVNKKIQLKIYNTLGQEVRTLINNQEYSAGTHTIQWDGTDNFGRKVASGVYIYQLKFGGFSISKRMTLTQ